MGTMTSYTTAKELLRSLVVCDIVEFNRIHYSHFAFYIGNGICVHVQAPDGSSSAFSSRSRSSPATSTSSSSNSNSGTKVAQLLSEITGNSPIRINNSELAAFQLGVNPRSQSVAIELALKGLPRGADGQVVLNQSVPVKYNIVSENNCEGWATYWKYDHPKGWSIQAANSGIHSTIGTVERLAEGVVFKVEETLNSDTAPIAAKAVAATVAIPYLGIKYAATGVKKTTDFVVGGVMRLLD